MKCLTNKEVTSSHTDNSTGRKLESPESDTRYIQTHTHTHTHTLTLTHE